jgi:urease accessory protein UreF
MRDALSEREREMARKSSSKRGAAIIALIAALAALAGPGAASAAPKTTAPAPAVSVTVGGLGEVASWAEEASWAE